MSIKDLDVAQTDRVIQMAWEDRTTFDAIRVQFGLGVSSGGRCEIKMRSSTPVEDHSVAFLLYVPANVWMIMGGRLLQASSDNVLLSVLLELGAVVAELSEARGESKR